MIDPRGRAGGSAELGDLGQRWVLPPADGDLGQPLPLQLPHRYGVGTGLLGAFQFRDSSPSPAGTGEGTIAQQGSLLERGAACSMGRECVCPVPPHPTAKVPEGPCSPVK